MRWSFAIAVLVPAIALTGKVARADGGETLPVNTTDTGTPRGYQAVRYKESYEHLASKPRREGLEAIKYVPLWSGGYLSIGGQHRIRYELNDPIDLGTGPGFTRSSVLLSRNLLHVDLHPMPGFRLFAQAGGFYVLGVPSAAASAPDANALDVTQLFVETTAEHGDLRLVTRVGRQEMPLGSTRWVSTRDGTNVRQSFDLVRGTVSVGKGVEVETFVGTAPMLKSGSFDDGPAWHDGFWGAYGTLRILPRKRMSIDAFYLGRRRKDAEYDVVQGQETRHTFGFRLFGETAFGLEYIEHGMVQVGSVADSNIVAWALSSALWQRLPGALRPVRIGVRSDALSGDPDPSRGALRTFHPLFPNQTFFGALPAIYPTNLYDVHPLVRLAYDPFEIEGGCIFFWRQSTADAVYAPPGPVLVAGSASAERYTGAQGSLSLAYRSSDRHLAVNAEYSHFFAGPGLSAAGGHAVDYFGAWTTFTY